MSIYELKPRFQALLRPVAGRLARAGITANQVTVAGALMSVAVGAGVAWRLPDTRAFVLIPLWMFARMACNAIDGMLAREHGQQSALGAFLNELTDVISDAALYLPFVAIVPFGWGSVGAVVFLSAVSEMAGALGPMIGGERRYDGPMGKSDRALWLGLFAMIWFAFPQTLAYSNLVFLILNLALSYTIYRRVRNGLRPQE